MRTVISEKLERDGYAVIENFLSPEEIFEICQAAKSLCLEATKEERRIFSFNDVEKGQERQKYFMDSAYKISYFFETGAVDTNNELLVPLELALEKIGHALHTEHPVFRRYTFDNRIREVCYQLGFSGPAIAISAYNYKNPGAGAIAKSYQNGTFLFTEPSNSVEFIFALEDTNLENGCLKVIRGSHNNGIHRRLIRNPDPYHSDYLIFDRPESTYMMSNFTSVAVPKGSLILLHSQIVQRSEQNKSNQPNPSYNFHVIETYHTKYAENNWIQPMSDKPFPILYLK